MKRNTPLRGTHILLLMSGLLLAACAGPVVPESPSPVPPADDTTQCAWVWATHEQPEATRAAQAALDAAGLAPARVTVLGFGEDCLNTQGGAVRFAVRNTFLDVTVPVTDLADRDALGNRAAQVLDALRPLHIAQMGQGSDPSMITFAAGSATQVIRFPSTWVTSGSQGLRGAALLDALGTAATP